MSLLSVFKKKVVPKKSTSRKPQRKRSAWKRVKTPRWIRRQFGREKYGCEFDIPNWRKSTHKSIMIYTGSKYKYKVVDEHTGDLYSFHYISCFRKPLQKLRSKK